MYNDPNMVEGLKYPIAEKVEAFKDDLYYFEVI